MNQGTLEDAAAWMARLALEQPQLRHEFEICLVSAIRDSQNGNQYVVDAVNRSGYRVSDNEEAGEYCVELLSLFKAAVRDQP